MTKKEARQVEYALNNINRAIKFLKDPRVSVCTDMLPNLTSFYNKDGKGITPICIGAGSDLVGIFAAKQNLESLLNPEPKTENLFA